MDDPVILPDADRVDPDQRRLAGALARALLAAGLEAEIRLRDAASEPWYAFHVPSPRHPELTLTLAVAPDTLSVAAGGAELRFPRVDADDDGDRWVAGGAALVTALLEGDLTVRVRHTLGGRKVGAVRVRHPGGDAWWGDALARLGLGHERTWPLWAAPPAGPGDPAAPPAGPGDPAAPPAGPGDPAAPPPDPGDDPGGDAPPRGEG